jgi:hypothetical protein
MTDDKAGRPPAKAAARANREKRLAEALRRNLKRRKAAAKQATETPQGKQRPQ